MADEKTFDDELGAEPEKDPLWYDGEGDLLDTAEGRAEFCRLNKSSLYAKEDPGFPGGTVFVYCNQGKALVVKKRSHERKGLYECFEFDADGNLTNSYWDF